MGVIRLHNLSARAPELIDLDAVVSLYYACDLAEFGALDSSFAKEDLQNIWHAPAFNRKSDAWVIVSDRGQVIGYAHVLAGENGQFSSLVRVHPGFRGRGIGTLLVGLTELRARQMTKTAPVGTRLVISNTVSHLNQEARALLEREGYAAVRSFWSLMIDIEDIPAAATKDASQLGRLKIDLVVDVQRSVGMAQLYRQKCIYVTRRYDVYEKELRSARLYTVDNVKAS